MTYSDILKTAVKLKNKSSHGHDGISTKLLKESISIIINPITHIINRSFDTGIVPHDMKMAKVVPIYKASDRSLLNNYRPVSLLPAFSKLLERLMYNKLMSYLTSSNILFKHQYGFRSRHSTIHRLSTFSIIVQNLLIKRTRNLHWPSYVTYRKHLMS